MDWFHTFQLLILWTPRLHSLWISLEMDNGQNGRHFADDTFKRISLNENVRISIKISPKFVPYGSINNILALVQIMAWRRAGDKPLFEPMVVRLPTHICVTRPQWFNPLVPLVSTMHGHSFSVVLRIDKCVNADSNQIISLPVMFSTAVNWMLRMESNIWETDCAVKCHVISMG